MKEVTKDEIIEQANDIKEARDATVSNEWEEDEFKSARGSIPPESIEEEREPVYEQIAEDAEEKKKAREEEEERIIEQKREEKEESEQEGEQEEDGERGEASFQADSLREDEKEGFETPEEAVKESVEGQNREESLKSGKNYEER